MTNYLLSIDPSIKNTGFTLGENKKPILITSYSFKKYNIEEFEQEYLDKLLNIIRCGYFESLDLIIERGFPNMMGSETQDHLRGFIAGTFNKLLTKDMLIAPKQGQNGYKNRPLGAYGDIKNEKGTKKTSLAMAQIIISENEGDFNITNHDEADSLLIGGYYLNKENK